MPTQLCGKLTDYRNQVINMIRIGKQRNYFQKCNQMKENIKGTWKVINTILCPIKTCKCRISRNACIIAGNKNKVCVTLNVRIITVFFSAGKYFIGNH